MRMDKYDELINMTTMNHNFRNEEVETFISSKEVNEKKEELMSRPGKGSTVAEESFHFKRYSKPRKQVYTEEEMNTIRESCIGSVVNDFGRFDIYHLNDEERKKIDKLESISIKLGTVKSVYHRIDEYIKAMRIVYEAWSILEKDNFIYSREEFFKLVAKGNIVSSRIPMPRLSNIRKYNLDTITEYISDTSLDPASLVPNRNDDIYDFEDEEEDEDKFKRLLSKDEAEAILNKENNSESIEKIRVNKIPNKYLKAYSENKKYFNKNKKMKKNKEFKYLAEVLKSAENQLMYDRKYNRYSSGMRDYSFINKLDIFKPEEKDNPLRFNGSWNNEFEVKLFDIMQTEKSLDEIQRNHYATRRDVLTNRFIEEMDNAGMLTTQLRERMNNFSTDDIFSNQSPTKDTKKVEAQFIQRLVDLNKDEKFLKTVKKIENELAQYREEME